MKNNKMPKCPNCDEPLVKIVYGMPGVDCFKKAEKKEIYLGGCIISDNNPIYHCNKCNRNYYENLVDFEEE